jgi:hypothetical protein
MAEVTREWEVLCLVQKSQKLLSLIHHILYFKIELY